MGAITPIGNTVKEFWQSLRAGKSGVERITHFDPSEFKTKIGCEVKDFDPKDYMDPKLARHSDPFTQFGVAACREAIADAGLTDTNYDPERTAAILGVGIGGFLTIQETFADLHNKGPLRISPFAIPKLIPNMVAGRIAMEYSCRGPVYTIASACASSTDAIGHCLEGIRQEHFDVAITGGVEAALIELGVAGFNALHALSTSYNDNPQVASRPFDLNRDGFILGEGAGILVLEDYEHAMNRRAPIYAEVLSGVSTNDAFHITAPHKDGVGVITAMQQALTKANLKASDIDYINAHGTSTKINDAVETASIKKVFGEAAQKVAISSTKSMHGHMIGATGAAEAIACIQAMRESFIPPTINYETPDPDCDLNYTPNVGVERPVEYAMSNSLGFGGHNSVLILKRYSDKN